MVQKICTILNLFKDIELVLCTMRDTEREAALARKSLIVSDYFTIVVRKMLEQTLLIFVKANILIFLFLNCLTV